MHHSTNDFDALVEPELRDGHGREQLVTEPDQWWEALIRRKTSIECQLGTRRLEAADADEVARAQLRKWRASALRFRAAIEDRLSLIRGLG